MKDIGTWKKMRNIQEEMDRVFEDFFSPPMLLPTRHLLPNKGNELATREQSLFRANVDLYETDKEIVAEFDLPGVDKKDIQLEIGDDSLEVKVEKKHEREEKKKDSYITERSFSGYYRCLPLPKYAKGEGVKAEYKSGVLKVTIPTGEDKKKPKKIEVD